MVRRGHKWQSMTLLTGALVLCTAAYGRPQFTSSNDRRISMLEGNWQSCRESDGKYSERIYDGKLPGLGPFELHMGPYHEFAFFRGIQDGHRDHNSTDNLLRPYNLEIRANSAKHAWDVDGLHLEVVLAVARRNLSEKRAFDILTTG